MTLNKIATNIARQIVPKDEWFGFVLIDVWQGVDVLYNKYPKYMKEISIKYTKELEKLKCKKDSK